MWICCCLADIGQIGTSWSRRHASTTTLMGAWVMELTLVPPRRQQASWRRFWWAGGLAEYRANCLCSGSARKKEPHTAKHFEKEKKTGCSGLPSCYWSAGTHYACCRQ